MNNKPAERHQADEKQDLYNEVTALDFRDAVDPARQEFKDEADVNTILRRYGYGAHGLPQRQPIYGEVNYDMDLQGAHNAIEQAKTTFRQIPDELLDKYPTWQAMLAGMATGAFGHDLGELKRAQLDARKARSAAADPANVKTDDEASSKGDK